jgi:hypothetical protein
LALLVLVTSVVAAVVHVTSPAATSNTACDARDGVVTCRPSGDDSPAIARGGVRACAAPAAGRDEEVDRTIADWLGNIELALNDQRQASDDAAAAGCDEEVGARRREAAATPPAATLCVVFADKVFLRTPVGGGLLADSSHQLSASQPISGGSGDDGDDGGGVAWYEHGPDLQRVARFTQTSAAEDASLIQLADPGRGLRIFLDARDAHAVLAYWCVHLAGTSLDPTPEP